MFPIKPPIETVLPKFVRVWHSGCKFIQNESGWSFPVWILDHLDEKFHQYSCMRRYHGMLNISLSLCPHVCIVCTQHFDRQIHFCKRYTDNIHANAWLKSLFEVKRIPSISCNSNPFCSNISATFSAQTRTALRATAQGQTKMGAGWTQLWCGPSVCYLIQSPAVLAA